MKEYFGYMAARQMGKRAAMTAAQVRKQKDEYTWPKVHPPLPEAEDDPQWLKAHADWRETQGKIKIDLAKKAMAAGRARAEKEAKERRLAEENEQMQMLLRKCWVYGTFTDKMGAKMVWEELERWHQDQDYS